MATLFFRGFIQTNKDTTKMKIQSINNNIIPKFSSNNAVKHTNPQENLEKNYSESSLNLLANYNKADLSFAKIPLDVKMIKNLNIPNLHLVDDKILRGKSLSSKKNRHHLSSIKKYGVESVIDLRDKYTSGKYQDLCNEQGLNYYHIPIDSATISDRQIVDDLPVLFDLLNQGKTYIACAQGLHRTDIALSLNYVFNPSKPSCPPVLYGHERDYGLKTDDIVRRLNSIKKEMKDSDFEKLGLDKNTFEKEFETRKAELIEFNKELLSKKAVS